MKEDTVGYFLRMALKGAQSIEDSDLSWQMTELLSFAEIDSDPAVGTITIGYGPWGYGLRISPEFINHCVLTPKDALFILLHEISHKLHGDLWADRRRIVGTARWNQQVANLAADMLINRCLERRFFTEGVPVLDRLYRPDRWPEVLLASPASIKRFLVERGEMRQDELLDASILARHFAGLGCDRAEMAAHCYAALLDPYGFMDDLLADLCPSGLIDFADIYLQLLIVFENHCEALVSVRFLGDHFGECSGEVLLDMDVAGKILHHGPSGKRAGRGESLHEDQIRKTRIRGSLERARAMVLTAIRRALVEERWKPAKHPDCQISERSVIFSPGRRELYCLAAGVTPIFYPQMLVGSGFQQDALWLYVDASGSMDEMLPILYGLLASLSSYLSRHSILLFSNAVVPVTISDIREGRVVTTRGTDFDCVVEHARREKAERILILTDGMGSVRNMNRKFLLRRSMHIYLVLTGGYETWMECPLVPLATQTWMWPQEV